MGLLHSRARHSSGEPCTLDLLSYDVVGVLVEYLGLHGCLPLLLTSFRWARLVEAAPLWEQTLAFRYPTTHRCTCTAASESVCWRSVYADVQRRRFEYSRSQACAPLPADSDHMFWYVEGKRMSVVVAGLSNAGKATFIQSARDQCAETNFSSNANAHTIFYHGINMSIAVFVGTVDPGFLYEVASAHSVIFVVDASDRGKLSTVKAEVDSVVSRADCASRSVLIVANKQDCNDAISPMDLRDFLHFGVSSPFPWFVCGCVAASGKGVLRGIDWICGADTP